MIAAVESKESMENEIAESLTGRSYVSWSQLTSFRSCPRKWHYSHVEAVESEFIASSLLFGSAIHTAVQHHYEQHLAGTPCEANELHDAFIQAWKDELKDGTPVKYGKTENESDLFDLAHRMLDAFALSELAQPEGAVVGVEETFVGSVSPELPDLHARIDLITQQTDGIQLIDLKTSKSRWPEHRADQDADQLLIYAEAAKSLSDGQTISLAYGVVTKAKTPAVQVLPVACDVDRVQQTTDLMVPIWHAMKAGVDFASPSPMNCSTCPFQSRCPAYRG